MNLATQNLQYPIGLGFRVANEILKIVGKKFEKFLQFTIEKWWYSIRVIRVF